MRWRSIVTRRLGELRLVETHSSETVCGWCPSRTPTATGSISRAPRMSPKRRNTRQSTTNSQFYVRNLSLRRHGSTSSNHAFRETLHFLKLWAELEQDKVDADGFKLREPLSDLLWR